MYNDQLSSVEDYVFALVSQEYVRARKFSPFNSEHEGYAVIKEEVDELWEAIKRNKTTTELDRMKEAIRVAAMAVKYVTSLASINTVDNLEEEE
jgi:NTP pyrophosphatase (non-canonical NTP hydrolase)